MNTGWLAIGLLMVAGMIGGYVIFIQSRRRRLEHRIKQLTSRSIGE